MESRCNECKFMKRFDMADIPEVHVNICTAEDPEESDQEGIVLLSEISEFDSSECLLFKPSGK